jgi:hypothetical protein
MRCCLRLKEGERESRWEWGLREGEREPLRVRTEEGEIGRAWDRETEQREGERKRERERRWERLQVNWGFFFFFMGI